MYITIYLKPMTYIRNIHKRFPHGTTREDFFAKRLVFTNQDCSFAKNYKHTDIPRNLYVHIQLRFGFAVLPNSILL